MIEEFLDEQNKFILEYWDSYENKYPELQEAIESGRVKREYFSGSGEMLCVFEPSLVKGLQCNWCLKGSLRNSKPKSKEYHTLYFDKNDSLRKIEYHCDVTNSYGDNHREIFVVSDKERVVYLVFWKAGPSDEPILTAIYILSFGENGMLKSYIHAPCRAMAGRTGEIHKYKGHYLIETIRFSMQDRKCDKFEFSYSDSGYMESYKMYDMLSESPNIYSASFTPKDIERFEKYGRYYFSPVAALKDSENGIFRYGGSE